MILYIFVFQGVNVFRNHVPNDVESWLNTLWLWDSEGHHYILELHSLEIRENCRHLVLHSSLSHVLGVTWCRGILDKVSAGEKRYIRGERFETVLWNYSLGKVSSECQHCVSFHQSESCHFQFHEIKG